MDRTDAMRNGRWTESMAVGNKEFVMATKANLGAKVIGSGEFEKNEGRELKEPQSLSKRVYDPEKCSLRPKNRYIWKVS